MKGLISLNLIYISLLRIAQVKITEQSHLGIFDSVRLLIVLFEDKVQKKHCHANQFIRIYFGLHCNADDKKANYKKGHSSTHRIFYLFI